MEDLTDFDKRHIWHPFTSLQDANAPLLIKSAEGIYLNADDGKKIIDAVSSWWVNIHGHSHPYIAQAVYHQAKNLEHVIFAGFTHEPAITLARNLLRILPSNQLRIFFSDNGSTAVEVALKMALQYWFNQNITKRKIIALEGAYHGDTFGAMSIGARSAFTRAFDPYLFEVEFVAVPSHENFSDVEERFHNLVSSGDVAAFIYEPLVQGAAGMVMYDASFLDKLVATAKKNNVVCVADEVFTGFGRTGKLFASDHLSLPPDIMAISKGITGGTLPLGVTSCSREIEEAFQSSDRMKTFFHGHSYTANPIACAAANASFELLVRKECQEAIARISAKQKSFASSVSDHPNVKDARCIGTVLAIELAATGGTSYFNDLRDTIYAFFIERNILLRPLGNVIYVLPPYIIKDEELNVIYSAINRFLDRLANGTSTEQN
jgi:adenosylmethionine---8-amino-7-oxononanoate aminotransferase